MLSAMVARLLESSERALALQRALVPASAQRR
jgi:hypothetical protein